MTGSGLSSGSLCGCGPSVGGTGMIGGMCVGSGLLACDRIGPGRMAEPQEILTHIQSLLHSGGNRDLQGQNVLISAGGTREYLDPVRFIGNPSTGKMGLALAQAAMHRGAKVTLVHGPASWEVPLGVEAIPVVSAESMGAAMKSHQQDANIIIMSAAVADVKPKNYNTQKLPK